MSKFGFPEDRGIGNRVGGFIGNTPSVVSGIFGLRSQYKYANIWPKAIAALYDFASFTFTNGTQTGRFGPSLENLLSAYGTNENPWLENTEFFNTSDGIQLWTVPASGIYEIVAYGASGGNGGRLGREGYGARIEGLFSLQEGEVIKILVGQMGDSNINIPTGGGGSFVVKDTVSTPTNNDILVIAGGGGGGAIGTGSTVGQEQADASLTTDGKTHGSSGVSGTHGTGGTNGNGGADGATRAGGGAGFFGNGGHASNSPVAQSFVNGGEGGRGSTSYTPERPGGFGGGGGSTSTTGWGASTGGGGYSGGSGVYSSSNDNSGFGGGGGSFNSGSSQSNTVLNSPGHGKVEITFLG